MSKFESIPMYVDLSDTSNAVGQWFLSHEGEQKVFKISPRGRAAIPVSMDKIPEHVHCIVLDSGFYQRTKAIIWHTISDRFQEMIDKGILYVYNTTNECILLHDKELVAQVL